MKHAINASVLPVLTMLFLAYAPSGFAYEIANFGDSYGAQTGGSSTLLICGDGKVIVGLRIKAGTYVDDLRLMCSEVASNNTLGTPQNGPGYTAINTAAAFLPGLSSTQRTFLCPSGYVLSGITARSGDWVDRIVSLRCTQYRGTATASVSVGMGGSGGTQSVGNCRDNDYVVHLQAVHGAWTDQLSVECGAQPAAVTIQPLSRPRTLPPLRRR